MSQPKLLEIIVELDPSRKNVTLVDAACGVCEFQGIISVQIGIDSTLSFICNENKDLIGKLKCYGLLLRSLTDITKNAAQKAKNSGSDGGNCGGKGGGQGAGDKGKNETPNEAIIHIAINDNIKLEKLWHKVAQKSCRLEGFTSFKIDRSMRVITIVAKSGFYGLVIEYKKDRAFLCQLGSSKGNTTIKSNIEDCLDELKTATISLGICADIQKRQEFLTRALQQAVQIKGFKSMDLDKDNTMLTLTGKDDMVYFIKNIKNFFRDATMVSLLPYRDCGQGKKNGGNDQNNWKQDANKGGNNQKNEEREKGNNGGGNGDWEKGNKGGGNSGNWEKGNKGGENNGNWEKGNKGGGNNGDWEKGNKGGGNNGDWEKGNKGGGNNGDWEKGNKGGGNNGDWEKGNKGGGNNVNGSNENHQGGKNKNDKPGSGGNQNQPHGYIPSYCQPPPGYPPYCPPPPGYGMQPSYTSYPLSNYHPPYYATDEQPSSCVIL